MIKAIINSKDSKNSPLNPPEWDLTTSPKKPPFGGFGGLYFSMIEKMGDRRISFFP